MSSSPDPIGRVRDGLLEGRVASISPNPAFSPSPTCLARPSMTPSTTRIGRRGHHPRRALSCRPPGSGLAGVRLPPWDEALRVLRVPAGGRLRAD